MFANDAHAKLRNRRTFVWRNAQRLVFPAFAAAVGGFMAAAYARAEQTLYYWDFIGWWERTTILAQLIRQSPSQACKAVSESIATSDYNLLAAVPPALWSLAGGAGRASFVTGLVVMYGLASAFALAWLCSVCLSQLSDTESAAEENGCCIKLIAAAIPFGLWHMWSLPFVTAMRGFVDLGACAIAFTCLALHVSRRERSWNAERAIAVGGLLALMFLFRRYWAFWISSYGFVICIDVGIEAWRLRRERCPVWFRPLATPCLAGFTLATVLALLALPLITRNLTTSYSDIYSAYQTAETGILELTTNELASNFRECGILATTMGLCSLAYLCLAQRSRRIGLLIAAVSMLAYLQFRRVQAPGIQHYLLWSTGLTAATAIAVSWLTTSLRQPYGWITALLALAAGSLQMTAACVPAAAPIRFLMACNASQLPLRRDDLAEVDRLIATLDQFDRKEAIEAIYCLSSSPALNFTTLVGYSASTGKPFHAIRRLLPTADVDKRDGFPRALLAANFLIVTDPPQLHLAASDQRIVTTPARQLLDGVGLGTAFERLPDEFTLDGAVRVYLFRRRSPLTLKHVLSLSDALKEAYPTRPFIYEYDYRAR